MAQDKETCIIVGAGSGLSASLARLFSAENMSVVLAARDIQKLKGLREEINCDLVQCDVTNIDQVESLFAQTDQILGKPSVVVYNPSARIRGDITSLDPVKDKVSTRNNVLWSVFSCSTSCHSNDQESVVEVFSLLALQLE